MTALASLALAEHNHFMVDGTFNGMTFNHILLDSGLSFTTFQRMFVTRSAYTGEYRCLTDFNGATKTFPLPEAELIIGKDHAMNIVAVLDRLPVDMAIGQNYPGLDTLPGEACSRWL